MPSSYAKGEKSKKLMTVPTFCPKQKFRKIVIMRALQCKSAFIKSDPPKAVGLTDRFKFTDYLREPVLCPAARCRGAAAVLRAGRQRGPAARPEAGELRRSSAASSMAPATAQRLPRGRAEADRIWHRHHVPKARAGAPQLGTVGPVLAGALQR